MLEGRESLWAMAESFGSGMISVRIDAVWLLHGWGLLRLNESSRLWAVRWAWFVRWSSIVVLLFGLVRFDEFKVDLWNWHPKGGEKLVAVALIILPVQLLCAWALRVLKDERLVQLFFDGWLSEQRERLGQQPSQV